MSKHQLHQSARGLYRVAVVDAQTQEIVWEQKDWGKNLILNNGMDQVAVREWQDCFRYAAAGTGITPTAIDSGAVTADQSSTTVTATVGTYTFSSGDIGNMIYWDDASEARITGYTNPQTVTVTPSQSVIGQHFIVYQTNQTELATEVKRASTFLPNLPDTGTTVSTGTGLVSMRRTFDFTAEVGNVNYTEIATCWSGTLGAGNTTFSRILLPSAVPVGVGQQLRFVYELQITVGPITPVSFSAAVSGWPVLPATNTDAQQQLVYHGLGIVAASGSGMAEYGGSKTNEPSTSGLNCAFWISPYSGPLTAFGTSAIRTAVTGYDFASSSLLPYTPLSFIRDKTATFTVAQVNRIDLRMLGTGYQNPSSFFAGNYAGIIVLFSLEHTKKNTQTLTFTFRYTWSRVLS